MTCGLIVALDTKTVADSRAIVARLGDAAFFYKIGMRFVMDPEVHAFIDELTAAKKRVFLDYKMYDIPATVRDTAQAVAARGIDLITVHGDPEIIEAAVEGVRGTFTRVLAVTVLTSQTDEAIQAMGHAGDQTVSKLVELRARNAILAGAHGVIASPHEAAMIRLMADPGFIIVTPGIRLPGAEAHDQRRVATPAEAAKNGADFVVVGRPILQAPDPAAAARTICDSLGNARIAA